MHIAVLRARKVILKELHRYGRSRLRSTVRIAAGGVLASMYVYAQTGGETLSQADRLADQGNWFRAAPLYAEAEKEFHQAGDRRNELYAKFGRLHGDTEAGFYRATRAQVARDITDPRVENDPQLKIRALSLLGTIDLNMDTAAAGDDWRQLLAVATAAGDRKWQNRANGYLGLVAGLGGNIGAAGSALYQAVMKAEQLGDAPGEIYFATWLANGIAVNNMADRAVQLLDRAEEVAHKNGYSEMPLQFSIAKVRALVQLPESQRARGREDAKKLLASTLELARKNGVRGAETELLSQAGQLAIEERNFASAEQSFKEVVEISKAVDLPREEADGLLHLSQLYRTEEAPAKAVPAINRGIDVLRRVEEAYDFPIYIAEKAEVEAALGALAAADALYDRATDLIDGLLVNAHTSRMKTEMIAAVGNIYVGHFRLAWDRLHDPEKAFRIVESARGRALLDSIRYARQSGPLSQETPGEHEIARLQRQLVQVDLSAPQRHRLLDQLDHAYFWLGPTEFAQDRKEMEMLSHPPASLTAIRRQLAANECLIEFVLDTKKSYALQISQGGLEVQELPGRPQIDRLVTRFLSGVRSKQESGDVAKALYSSVLSLAINKPTTAVIVVPDGSLNLVPFEALMDEDGATINKRLTIASVPSATIYFTLKTGATQSTATKPFLGVVYSPGQSALVQLASNTRGIFDLRKSELKPLQFAREEIGQAAKALGKDSVELDGAAASEAAVKALSLRDFKIIHIAAHGIANDAEPDRAALLLAPGNDSEDGLWQSREIRQTRLNADLVVLSACDTGTGRLEGQEGIMNLARAFLIAGAKSVVASFFHQSVRRVPGRLAIGASFRRAETEAGPRWVAQDVHEGGPADSGGLRPLDVLTSINGTLVCPPDQPMFPMRSQVDLALRRGADEIALRVTIPEPRSRRQPYSELKAVAWARMAHGVGYLKVSILPGQVGLDVSRAIDAAVGELESCDRLVLDLRGHLGGGLGVLRLMSHLTPAKLPIGYTITRRRAETGYDKSRLPKLDRLPTHLPNFLGVASMVFKYVGRDPSILLVSEGLGAKKWHGRIVILVNEHTVSAGEMIAAFASENHLATIMGTETAGRLIPGSGFKVGQGYMLTMPKAAYITWHGQRFEGAGVKPDVEVPWSPEAFATGKDNQLESAVQVVSGV